MADLLSTGLSGLLAFQRALDTTSHNIANVNTPGYSRQRVELGTREAHPYGNGWIGTGVDAQTTRRLYDELLAMQTRTTSSSLEHLDIFAASAERLNNMFGHSTTGLTATLQNFANAFQSLADAPTSTAARQVLLSEASTLQQRLQYFDERLSDLDAEVNSRLQGEVAEINTLTEAIARLNSDIATATARSGGQPPNDLLDERDRLLDELSGKISISTVKQDDGAINVFIAKGQPLVLGANANRLTTVPDSFDPTRLGVALDTDAGPVDLTSSLSGGVLGGALAFRKELLDPAHNALGRIAVGLAQLVNDQHREGIDLSGALGGDFFAIGGPEVLPRDSNAGSGTVSVTYGNASGLTERDYVLELTGSGWQLRDSQTGAAVTMTGSGTAADPFVADGLEIVVGGAANVGDEFLIRPTRAAVADMQVLISDPSRIAAAAPIRTEADADNTGSASISAGEVIDASHPDLRDTVTIEFLTPTTYSINGVGNFPYTDGGNIEVNGWRVQISGTPAAGDRFTISDNSSGTGDNRNALELANALTRPVLNNGTTSLSGAVGQFVSGIGVATRQAQANRDAQSVVHQENIAAQDSVSGVNLDEEAANLLKYQQAYQAAAQLIRIADTLFQTLLGATQR
ncbi:MAG TPA: flagellar hook-associated protein FlgK [Steroidobacteraceae bacterium]